MDIIKPNNDNRIYKYCILNNNIKCILINDKSLDKCNIVTSINIGSFANKDYYDGMAHLLEHMCFITSNKYKERGFLQKKVNESGGFTNAFTAENNTVYYLEIFNDYVEEILEIFVDFLTNAELKEEYILDELENVDSEHQKNLFNDGWRLYNLEKMLGDETSNYNSFYTGSKNTLNKSDIYIKMVDFYKKYYVSNNISVCIASKYNIENLYDIINKSFGMIKKSNIINDFKLIKPFYKINNGNQYLVKSKGSSKLLVYLFETPINVVESKIFNLFIKIICSPEDNLCLDHLKSLGYIDNIDGIYELYGLVKISIKITDKGLKNILYVDNIIYNFLNKILELDWFNIFESEKKKNLFLFNNLSKIDTLDLCTDFLIKLSVYEPKYVYISDYYYSNINESDIKLLKKYINIKNCIRLLLTDNMNIKTNILIDPYYGTEYCKISLFKNSDIDFNIKYNLNNPYKNIKPLFIKKLNIKPYKIHDNYWYGSTSKFKESNVHCNIIFSKKEYFNSPINNILTNISVKILNYYLYKKMYKAIEYNFNIQLNANNENNCISLNLYTFNDAKYIQMFINDIFDILFSDIDISDELISSIISTVEDNIKNIIILNSWDFCNYLFSNSFDNSYYYLKLLKYTKKISINHVKKYIKTLFDNTGINIFVYGNIKLNDLPIFNKLNNKHKLYNFSKLTIKKNIIVKHPNNDEKTNCVQITYFVGKFNPNIILHLLFLRSMSSNLFFRELRTNKKLGYLVQMYSSIISNQYYIYQKIQSEVPCDDIIKHIKIFNNNLIDNIKKENFNKWKKIVINELNKKETNMNELYYKYLYEINERTYLFDRNKILLKYINEITQKTLINFINKYMLYNKKINITQVYY
jgi:insulysin